MGEADEARVDAKLVLLDGKAVRGRLVELGGRSITIAAPIKGTPEIERGSRLHFELSGELVRGEHVADGHLERAWEHGGLKRFAVRYADAEDFERLLSTPVGRHFNRRGAFRVEPSTKDPIVGVLTLESGDVVDVHVLDISASGVAIDATQPPLDALTRGTEGLELKLPLPGSIRPAELVVEVAYVGEGARAGRVGLRYDARLSRGFAATQDRIIDYVMARQREQLREQRHKERAARR